MNKSEKTKLVYFLEQDLDDQEITEAISKESGFHVKFVFFSDEREFLQALASTTELPKLILLNYHTVTGSGLELLHVLKTNFRLMRIPVIVLSERVAVGDIQQAYLYGASSYITKPFSNTDTVRKITVFLEYWFQVVELPDAPEDFKTGQLKK